jgi:hypothetical protein
VGSIFLSQVPFLDADGIADVAQSKWASRAWTFQESFRSRRRLIFTDHQIIFVCNSGIKYMGVSTLIDVGEGASQEERYRSLLEKWLPHGTFINADWIQYPLDAMGRAKKYIEAYTQRQLSYDEDALSAIRGALELLEREAVYHVWGTPVQVGGSFNHVYILGPEDYHPRISFNMPCSEPEHLQQPKYEPSLGYKTPDPTSSNTIHRGVSCSQHPGRIGPPQVDIALMWYHRRPCRHRTGFPTWSPIAWSGPVEWFYGPMVQEDHTPGVNESIYCDWGLLSQLVTTSTPLTNNTTQHLQIRLRTLALESIEPNRDFYIGLDELSVATSITDDVKVVFRPYWDMAKSSLGPNVHLKGALIFGTGGKEHLASWKVRGYGLFMLILSPGRKENHNSYQRVGIVHLRSQDWGGPDDNSYCMIVSKKASETLSRDVVHEAISSIDKWSWREWETIFTDYETIQLE